MAKGFRPLAKMAFYSLTALSLVCTAPRPAMAQFGGAVFDGPAEASLDAIDATTSSMAATLVSILAAFEIQTEALLNGPDGLNNDFEELGATITSNATSTNAIIAKGFDKLSADAHVKGQQEAQATIMGDSATGALSYQRGNLCQMTTLVGARSSMRNGHVTELAGYNAYRTTSPTLSAVTTTYTDPNGGSTAGCATCGGNMGGIPSPPGVLAAEFATSTISARLANWVKASTGFYGVAEGGTDNQAWAPPTGTSYTVVDTAPATHLDVHALGMSETPTYTDVYRLAHDMFANYIVGMQPDVVTPAAFKTNPAQFSSALIANHEKLAYYNLSSEALAQERDYHEAKNSGATQSVINIYKSENLADPSFNGQISAFALDHTIYESPADDPNFIVNAVGTTSNNVLLQEIDHKMTLLNNIEYKRYLQEMQMYKVQSASLALQSRSFNFNQNP